MMIRGPLFKKTQGVTCVDPRGRRANHFGGKHFGGVEEKPLRGEGGLNLKQRKGRVKAYGERSQPGTFLQKPWKFPMQPKHTDDGKISYL